MSNETNSNEIRQRLHHEIDQLPSELLALAANFLEFLAFKHSKTKTSPQYSTQTSVTDDEATDPTLADSTVADLLQFVGTWQGDDFEDCLQSVLENRTRT